MAGTKNGKKKTNVEPNTALPKDEIEIISDYEDSPVIQQKNKTSDKENYSDVFLDDDKADTDKESYDVKNQKGSETVSVYDSYFDEGVTEIKDISADKKKDDEQKIQIPEENKETAIQHSESYSEIYLDDTFGVEVKNDEVKNDEFEISEPQKHEIVIQDVILDTAMEYGASSDQDRSTNSKMKKYDPIVEDVLFEEPENIITVPVDNAEINPIKAAFENRQDGAWISPETILYTSVDVNSKKMEQIIAKKKMPVNPKYKKSFFDKLLKR
ncbi:MAG: hypothetical protein LBH98_04170 [Chitinispirillales bacterium]|jgi:hypothetical protein|nr:hypothetical protein [Chitinispirillales bacterium]